MFNKDITKHLSELSKIAFTDIELSEITADMSEIINLMDKVRGFNSDTQPYTKNSINCKDLRVDTTEQSLCVEDILKNAKTVVNDSFTVPKIV